MNDKCGKLFVIKQPTDCKFMPKMQQSTLGGRVPPGPAWGAYVLPRFPSRNVGGYF